MIDMEKIQHRHFKGNTYEVIAVVKHTETQEELVIYRKTGSALNALIYIRPLSMWKELVDVPDGQRVFRFTDTDKPSQSICAVCGCGLIHHITKNQGRQFGAHDDEKIVLHCLKCGHDECLSGTTSPRSPNYISTK